MDKYGNTRKVTFTIDDLQCLRNECKKIISRIRKLIVYLTNYLNLSVHLFFTDVRQVKIDMNCLM